MALDSPSDCQGWHCAPREWRPHLCKESHPAPNIVPWWEGGKAGLPCPDSHFPLMGSCQALVEPPLEGHVNIRPGRMERGVCPDHQKARAF